MNKRNILGGYRLFFGGLTLVAVITQLIVSSERPTFSLTNFLSFFTIESNIIAAVLFIISGLLTFKGGESTAVSIMRGAATLYMTVTGVVYILLLSGLEESLQMTLPWVNIALHYVMPAAVLIDWFMDLPNRRMQFKRALVWLVFPALYLVYSLVRGEAIGWYPYPFLDPANNGYEGVAVASIGILLGMLALTWLLTKSTYLRPKKSKVAQHKVGP